MRVPIRFASAPLSWFMLHRDITGETLTYSDWFGCFLITCRLKPIPGLLPFPALVVFLLPAPCFLFLFLPLHALPVLYMPVYEILSCPATVCHVAGAEVLWMQVSGLECREPYLGSGGRLQSLFAGWGLGGWLSRC